LAGAFTLEKDPKLRPAKAIRTLFVCGILISAVLWFASPKSSQAVGPDNTKLTQVSAAPQDSGYVGSDACKDCHEDQFKAFTHTSHAQLSTISSWKGKVTGCEACHGPGKAHSAEGDPKKIISFKNKSSKETSETCLTCHAGKEEHNNFRRGEHWRNDIGCTDCHAPHASPTDRNLPSSNVFVARANAQKPGFSTIHMLKVGEPQLCMSCHSETKPDFNKDARVRPKLFKIHTRQSESFSAAVSVMPPPRDEFTATDAARKQWPLTLRRMSWAAVREFCKPDLHDVSYRCEIKRAETVSAIEQLQHEIRSRTPRENGRRWLRYLSSTFA
jgi:nitrate/TMAO reductase-like tetraheme cytochrome c subunit